jgi:hypothetical protein
MAVTWSRRGSRGSLRLAPESAGPWEEVNGGRLRTLFESRESTRQMNGRIDVPAIFHGA